MRFPVERQPCRISSLCVVMGMNYDKRVQIFHRDPAAPLQSMRALQTQNKRSVSWRQSSICRSCLELRCFPALKSQSILTAGQVTMDVGTIISPCPQSSQTACLHHNLQTTLVTLWYAPIIAFCNKELPFAAI